MYQYFKDVNHCFITLCQPSQGLILRHKAHYQFKINFFIHSYIISIWTQLTEYMSKRRNKTNMPIKKVYALYLNINLTYVYPNYFVLEDKTKHKNLNVFASSCNHR